MKAYFENLGFCLACLADLLPEVVLLGTRGFGFTCLGVQTVVLDSFALSAVLGGAAV